MSLTFRIFSTFPFGSLELNYLKVLKKYKKRNNPAPKINRYSSDSNKITSTIILKKKRYSYSNIHYKTHVGRQIVMNVQVLMKKQIYYKVTLS